MPLELYGCLWVATAIVQDPTGDEGLCVCVFMFVCVYCMCVCMFVCMYACMYVILSSVHE